jgi:hypothetical protein
VPALKFATGAVLLGTTLSKKIESLLVAETADQLPALSRHWTYTVFGPLAADPPYAGSVSENLTGVVYRDSAAWRSWVPLVVGDDEIRIRDTPLRASVAGAVTETTAVRVFGASAFTFTEPPTGATVSVMASHR